MPTRRGLSSAGVYRDRGRTAAYLGGHVVLGLVTASLGPTIGGLATRVGGTAEALGWLFSVRAIGYLFGSLFAGRAYDKTAGHPILSATTASLVALFLLVPAAHNTFSLAAILLAIGAGQGVLDVGDNTLLSWVHGSKTGPFTSALSCFFGAGALLSTILVMLGKTTSSSYFLLALAIAPATLLFGLTPSPDRPEPHTSINTRLANPILIFLLAILFFLYQGAEVSFGGWIFTYANAVGLSDKSATTLTSVFWSSFTLGRMLVIGMSVRIAPSRILLLSGAAALFGVSLILVFPGSYAALFAGVMVVGFSLASVLPMAISLAGRESLLSGRITRFFLVSASAGSMLLPWLIGRSFAFGPRGPMFVFLVDIVALCFVFGLLSKQLVANQKTQKMGSV